jgi:hypothetical protein
MATPEQHTRDAIAHAALRFLYVIPNSTLKKTMSETDTIEQKPHDLDQTSLQEFVRIANPVSDLAIGTNTPFFRTSKYPRFQMFASGRMFATANMRRDGDSPATLSQTPRIVNLFGYPQYVVSGNEGIHKPSDSGSKVRGSSRISPPECLGGCLQGKW